MQLVIFREVPVKALGFLRITLAVVSLVGVEPVIVTVFVALFIFIGIIGIINIIIFLLFFL